MIEELLIRIRSIAQLGGFDQLNSKMDQANRTQAQLDTSSKKTGQTLNETGTHANNMGTRMNTADAHAKKLRGTLAGFAGISGMLAGVFSITAILMFTQAAIDSNKAWRVFFSNQHLNWATQKQEMANQKKAVYDLAQTYGVATSDIRDTMSKFIARGSNFAKAQQETDLAVLLNAARPDLEMTSIEEWIAGSESGGRGLKQLEKATGLTAEQLTNDGKHLDLQKAKLALQEKYADTLEEQGKSDEANLIRAQNAWSKVQVTLGNLVAGPLSTFAGYLAAFADWFNGLDANTRNWIAGIVIIGALFLGLAPFLKPAYDMISGIGDKIKDISGKKITPNIDCNPCPGGSQVGGGGKSGNKGGSKGTWSDRLSQYGPFSSMGALSSTLTAGIVGVITSGVEKWVTGPWVQSTASSLLGSDVGGIAARLGVGGQIAQGNMVADATAQNGLLGGFATQLVTSMMSNPAFSFLAYGQDRANQTGMSSNYNMPLLPDWDKLSQMGIIPQFKWPTSEDVLNVVKNMVPGLNWDIPGAASILQQIGPKIWNLIWQIPSNPAILGQIGSKIWNLVWQIPGAPQILGYISEKITWLSWHVPSSGEVLQAIVNHFTGGPQAGSPELVGAGDVLYGQGPYYEPILTNNTSSSKTIIAPNIQIDSIDSKDTADYFVKELTSYLSGLNDAKGN